MRPGVRADVYGGIRAAVGRAVPNLPFIKIMPRTAQLEEDARLWMLGARILSWFGGSAADRGNCMSDSGSARRPH